MIEAPIQTLCRPLFAYALLLALTFGVVAPATAQPAVSEEEVALSLMAEFERNLTNPAASARLTEAQWDAYGDNLERALASGHEGCQQGALRMIIFYGDNLEISQAGVHEIVRIYRNNADDRLRRMAVIALGRTQNAWGLDFLTRSARFEKSPDVQHTIQSVLAASRNLDLGPAKVGS